MLGKFSKNKNKSRDRSVALFCRRIWRVGQRDGQLGIVPLMVSLCTLVGAP